MSNLIMVKSQPFNSQRLKPPVNDVTVLRAYVEAVKKELAAFKPFFYEDNVFELTDYNQHLTSDTYHTKYQRVVGLSTKTPAGASHAIDINFAVNEREGIKRAILLNKAFGIAYHHEGAGTWNEHLHSDDGPYVSDVSGNNGWYTPLWPGTVPGGWKRALQVDGGFGPNTIRRLQGYLGVTTDGSFGPASTRALQLLLLRRGYKTVKQTGVMDEATERALRLRLGTETRWGSAWFTGLLQQRLNLNNL